MATDSNKRRKRKCKCPDAETLDAYRGSVINWPHWNLEDCPVHKGDNSELDAEADRIRAERLKGNPYQRRKRATV